MCDNFDDFKDDFDNDDFIDDNSFEDSLEGEIDEPFAGDSELDDEPDQVESKEDEFTAKDGICDDGPSAREAAILGGAMGFAYEEGLNERKRRKRKRSGDDSDGL